MKTSFILSIILLGVAAVCILTSCGQKEGDQNEKHILEHHNKNVINLEDEDSELTIPLGTLLQYSHSVWGSVGSSYWLEYDKSAFKQTSDIRYHDQKGVESGMCGGDQATKTCILEALKKGIYQIKVIHDYRGETERLITYTITVK